MMASREDSSTSESTQSHISIESDGISGQGTSAEYETSTSQPEPDIELLETISLKESVEESNSRRGSRIYKSLTFCRKKKSEKTTTDGKKRKCWWSFKLKRFPVSIHMRKGSVGKGSQCSLSDNRRHSSSSDSPGCVCMGYKKTDDRPGSVFYDAEPSTSKSSAEYDDVSPASSPKSKRKGKVKWKSRKKDQSQSFLDMTKFDPDEYPVEDQGDDMCAKRARDIEDGVEIPPNIPYHSGLASNGAMGAISSLGSAFQQQCVITTTYPTISSINGATLTSESHFSEYGSLTPQGTYVPHTIHTQVDYIHCLVPDLAEITNSSNYWGVMDRYEAEKLLENKAEGTFLLRDSAQEDFLFSVSFRRYSRSLHARIEQWNHKFSFDSHDPGVFSSDTVCKLIEHYKDPSCCMFFEPLLSVPLNRTFPFSLQHLCRSIICNRITYDGVNWLPLPNKLKEYLKYYHYKQKVRVRRFEVTQ